jgi:hypothetical protein
VSIVIVFVYVAVQPDALVTVTVSVIVPFDPAVNVIEGVPAPLVTVPFLIVHEYVAPGPASGTDAAFPVELWQTTDGAVIVASGTGLTGMVTESLALHAEAVTVTLKATDPDEPAVNWMLRVPAPDVIVPFAIDHVYVAPPPPLGTDAEFPVESAQRVTGAVITADGLLFVTLAVPFALQPVAFVTVTLIFTGEAVPASHVIMGVPLPDVIVPLVRAQAYVAPGPASGTEARLPVEPGQTDPGAVMVALGGATTVTVADPEALQPDGFVTVTASPTTPDAPAVNVIVGPVAPAVMVPFVIVHAYVAPAPALGTDAVLPVETIHTAAGAVIAAEGVGFTVTTALPEAVPGPLASETFVTE